jgi:hypothetical protein
MTGHSVHDDSSDSMIDIQIEDSLIKETLMFIDSTNFARGLRAMFIFATSLFCIVLVGIFGPPSVLTFISPAYPIFQNTPGTVQSLEFAIENLSALNRFLRISFVLFRNSTIDTLTSSIQYRYEHRFSTLNATEELQSDLTQIVPLSLRPGQPNTPRLVTLSDVLIRYQTVNSTLHLMTVPAAFTSARLIGRYGHPKHAYFQAVFRIAFSIITVVASKFLWFRLRPVPISLWHLEQKLTMPLLVFAAFYNGPLFPIQLVSPSRSYIIFDTIARALFTSYFRFFVLSLFDSLVQEQKSGALLLPPQVRLRDLSVSVVRRPRNLRRYGLV